MAALGRGEQMSQGEFLPHVRIVRPNARRDFKEAHSIRGSRRKPRRRSQAIDPPCAPVGQEHQKRSENEDSSHGGVVIDVEPRLLTMVCPLTPVS